MFAAILLTFASSVVVLALTTLHAKATAGTNIKFVQTDVNMSNVLLAPLSALLILLAPLCHALECLESNSGTVIMELSQVYNNGKLKVRIDEAQGYISLTKVVVRSNAPGLNRSYYNNDGTKFSNFLGKDNDLCPGVELSMRCHYVVQDALQKVYFECRFSEF